MSLDFRIIGSGESEQNSVIPGVLANLERDAPRYGGYWDFNTFYFGAVCNAKSGTSGSPIIAPSGNAIALMCGGSFFGAASFFLPLGRVKRALEILQRGEQVYRGTVLCIFKHTTFDEVSALGLASETEKEVRKAFPKAEGMLVVGETVPGGPADEAGLRPGDVLVKLQGNYVRSFGPLQEVLDDAKVTEVEMLVSRGGKEITYTVQTENMENVTPSKGVSIGNALVHPLGFIPAVTRNLPVDAPMVASSGYMFTHAGIRTGAIITEIDGKKVATMEEFEQVISTYPDRSQVLVKHYYRKSVENTAVVDIDRRWFPMTTMQRNDVSGFWDFETIEYKPPAKTGEEAEASSSKTVDLSSVRSTNPKNALVLVEFRAPKSIEGNQASKTIGCGVVLSLEDGLILVPRSALFSFLGDVKVTFNSLFELEADTVFLHPVYNFGFVHFDPAKLIGKGVKVCDLELNEKPFEYGEKADFIGISMNRDYVFQSCTLTTKERLMVRMDTVLFTPMNHEALVFDQEGSLRKCSAGVFLTQNKQIGAFWLYFQRGFAGSKAIPANIVAHCLKHLRKNAPSDTVAAFEKVPIQSLGVSLHSYPLGKIRQAAGLPDEWVNKLLEVDADETRQVLYVNRIMVGTGPAEQMKQGDFVLALDGKAVTSFEQFEMTVTDRKVVEVSVLRNKKVEVLQVETMSLYPRTVERVLSVAGLTLHETPNAVRFQGFLPDEIDSGGVYVAAVGHGSPARRAKMRSSVWITKVKDVPTPNLDSLLDEIMKFKDKEWVSFEVARLNGSTEVYTLQNDHHYFGPSQLVRSAEGEWIREALA